MNGLNEIDAAHRQADIRRRLVVAHRMFTECAVIANENTDSVRDLNRDSLREALEIVCGVPFEQRTRS